MQRSLKRMIAAVLLGSVVAFGTIVGGHLAQPTPAMACPGGGTGGGGGC
jgi:hypothetical protein